MAFRLPLLLLSTFLGGLGTDPAIPLWASVVHIFLWLFFFSSSLLLTLVRHCGTPVSALAVFLTSCVWLCRLCIHPLFLYFLSLVSFIAWQ
jgi:hypothetical protein